MEIHMFPEGVRSELDMSLLAARLQLYRPAGTITVPSKAIDDLRYRLVQCHEIMHDHQQQIEPTWFGVLKQYIGYQIATGKVPRGEPVLMPIYATHAQMSSALMNMRVIAERPNGKVFEGVLPEGVLATGIILSQYNELFAEFFSSAAAGASYWSTLRDFELDCDPQAWTTFESEWDPQYKNLFDPHPVFPVRLGLLPLLFCDVFQRAVIGGTSERRSRVVFRKRSQLGALNVPALPKDAKLTFVCDRVEGSLGEISIPLSFMRPYYEAAYEAFRMLMMKWWTQTYYLAAFPEIFFRVDYHERIDALAKEFLSAVPQPATGPLQWVDRVAGVAAARQCFDEAGSGVLVNIQPRAKQFLKDVQSGLVSVSA